VVNLTEEDTADLDRLEELLKDGVCHALAVQQPNFFGSLEPLKEISYLAKKYEVPLVVADPIALSILKPPGSPGADIVVGEGHQMGAFLDFGVPMWAFLPLKWSM
jgi:glycine dehydrogenase subunit 1